MTKLKNLSETPSKDECIVFITNLAKSKYSYHIDDDINDIVWHFTPDAHVVENIRHNINFLSNSHKSPLSWEEVWEVYASAV
jgi:hypothetical protein